MDRSFFRFFVAVALVFLFSADLKILWSPILNVFTPNSKLVDPTKKKTDGDKSEQIIDDQIIEDDDVDDGDDDEEVAAKRGSPSLSSKSLLLTIKNSCLPKLICELNATPNRERLSETERSLLNLIKDTSISITAETTSKYHFAAHMGQLIAGVEGTGCHNFYPSCPFPGLKVLQMMKKVQFT